MGQHKRIIIDGANIAYLERSQANKPQVSNLVAVRQELEKRGYEVIILVDASLRHEIDDPTQLEGMIDNQTVLQVPAGTEADYFVLETADELDALILSNDRYQKYQSKHDWIKERRIPVMIINGDIYLYEPGLEQEG